MKKAVLFILLISSTLFFSSHALSQLLPDLIVESIVTDIASPVPGQEVYATVTVLNQGPGDAGDFIVDFYRNLSASPNPYQYGDSYYPFAGLAAGERKVFGTAVTYGIEGTYNIWVQVDTNLQVAESDEGNNILGPHPVVVHPDISVTLIPDSTSLSHGDTFGYTVIAASNSFFNHCFNFWTSVSLPSGNKYPPSGEMLGPYNLCLAPFGTRTEQMSHPIPGKAPLGIYSYNAYAGPYPLRWSEDSIIFELTPSGGITFENTFGGANFDYGSSSQQTADGGYVIAGNTGSAGAGMSDLYLVKTTADGSFLWDVTYGGAYDDSASSVQQTVDGGYIVAGYTRSSGAGQSDFYLVKTDGDGGMIWERTFGGAGYEYGSSVVQTADGGYVIAGKTDSYGAGGWDVYLVKTDADGNLLWDSSFGGTQKDEGNSVRQTADGGYIITGYTESSGAGMYLIKTDAEGIVIWESTFEDMNEGGNSVQQTVDGGYIVAGTKGYVYSGSNVSLIKAGQHGTPEWVRDFGRSDGDRGLSVQQTADGGYIISGHTDIDGTNNDDVYLIKADTSGNIIWENTFGGPGRDYGNSVAQASDGGYVIGGYSGLFSQAEMYLIKTDPHGQVAGFNMQCRG